MPDLVLAVPALLTALAVRWVGRRSPPRRAVPAFLDGPPTPMPPVLPPRAANDDLMVPVYDAVEHDLRRAGYLG